jgi:prepilin-type N-terminal cleavage/methylation domain-containing protein
MKSQIPNLKSQISQKGFTLIELLVVISIIGILAALAMVSFTTSQRQARDTERKSDVKQYQTSLEAYANKSGSLYPSRPDSSGVAASSTLCTDLSLTTCPEDPKFPSDATYFYKYQSNGTASDGTAVATKYVVWAKLENSSNYWVVCSNGKAGTKAQSGFSVSSGTCPL